MSWLVSAACLVVLPQASDAEAANPFEGKVIVLGNESVHENVRTATLGETHFIVLPPRVFITDGKASPKSQIWLPLSQFDRFDIYDNRKSADEATKERRERTAQLNPDIAKMQIKEFAQPQTTAPFKGKIVLISFDAGASYVTKELPQRKIGDATYIALRFPKQKQEIWRRVSTVRSLQVFDSIEDADTVIKDNPRIVRAIP